MTYTPTPPQKRTSALSWGCIFAGGQMFAGHTEEEIAEIIRGVYREVFTKIKPSDLACIGIYQAHKNQLRQDTELFREVMATV